MTALCAALAAALTAPTLAEAATGDDGAPIVLAPAASIRNMNPDLAVALGGTERAYAISVAGPVAAAAPPRSCSTGSIPLNPGALTHDIRVARSGVLAPDGSISGA